MLILAGTIQDQMQMLSTSHYDAKEQYRKHVCRPLIPISERNDSPTSCWLVQESHLIFCERLLSPQLFYKSGTERNIVPQACLIANIACSFFVGEVGA